MPIRLETVWTIAYNALDCLVREQIASSEQCGVVAESGERLSLMLLLKTTVAGERGDGLLVNGKQDTTEFLD